MAYPTNTILQGDALTVLRDLPDESVQMCVTSPPYYRKRDYGVEGQIGLEATPQEFIAKLVALLREVRRILRKNGILWLNLGDTYARGRYGRYDSGDQGKFAGPPLSTGETTPPAGFASKDLMLLPHRVAIALHEDGWHIRSDCVWSKPNAMPDPVEDRPSSSHEYVFLLTKNECYFYNAEAIREPLKPKTLTTYGCLNRQGKGNDALGLVKADNWSRTVPERKPRLDEKGEPAGANRRSVWTIASEPLDELHFATMPSKLAEVCILAGSRPGDVVLDPFMGAGTTALVAIRHHRNWLGIELDPKAIRIASRRIATVQTTLWEEGAD